MAVFVMYLRRVNFTGGFEFVRICLDNRLIDRLIIVEDFNVTRSTICMFLLFAVCYCPIGNTRSSVQPVFADGWVVAGNRTVGNAVRYMRVGMWDEAQGELQRMLGYRPRNHAALFNLGVCFERAGNTDTARQFYERAIDLRSENLYCENLARLDGVSGKGAEFVKFVISCDSVCNHGYAYARAGLWEMAIKRFEASLASRFSAAAAHNLAVSYEVVGLRQKAQDTIQLASSLGDDFRHQEFLSYFASAPDLPLEMLTSLPMLTTTSDLPVIANKFTNRNNAIIRLKKTHDSVVLSVLERNSHVDVLEYSSSWARVRTRQNKEGFIPSLFLSSEYAIEEQVFGGYSLVHYESQPPIDSVTDDETMYLESDDFVFLTVQTLSDGQPVAVRRQPSLMSEIVGHIEPGLCLKVIETDFDAWFQIYEGTAHKGFILKMHVTVIDKEH
jgi:uncharacterized protein YgiM (DUF1202 family)